LAKCDYDLITCPNDSDEFAQFVLKYLSDFN
ncbi:ferrochelatase, partial [Campylobacter coli]|nr:ferrochelatase [Campylobacter coli]